MRGHSRRYGLWTRSSCCSVTDHPQSPRGYAHWRRLCALSGLGGSRPGVTVGRATRAELAVLQTAGVPSLPPIAEPLDWYGHPFEGVSDESGDSPEACEFRHLDRVAKHGELLANVGLRGRVGDGEHRPALRRVELVDAAVIVLCHHPARRGAAEQSGQFLVVRPREGIQVKVGAARQLRRVRVDECPRAAEALD